MIEVLAPFIVTQCSGAELELLDPECRALCAGVESQVSDRPNPAVFLFLDHEGKFRRMVNPLEYKRKERGPMNVAGKLDGALLEAIADVAKELGMAARRFEETGLHLPTVDGQGPFAGVRVSLSIGYLDKPAINYLAPTIEAVPVSAGEKAALAWPESPREVAAKELKAWLKQIYPPAIMDSYGHVVSGSGTLRLSAADPSGGVRRAILSGEVELVLDDSKRTRYKGKVEGVVLYGADSDEPIGIRAVYVGRFPKASPNGEIAELELTAAIESLPE